MRVDAQPIWKKILVLCKFAQRPNSAAAIMPVTEQSEQRAFSGEPAGGRGKGGKSMWGDVQIIGKKKLPPDPQVMRAIGLNHSFESAVADIVDCSPSGPIGQFELIA